jgi:hypothetical protein
MARRSSEELLAEFHKRYDILEAIRECFMPSVNFFSTPEENGNTQREGMLRAVETGETTLSQVISGINMAIVDMFGFVEDIIECDSAHVKVALACYKAKTGRDYWSDEANPKALLKAIIKRGLISDDEEFYLVKELTYSVGQKMITQKQLEKAYSMLDQYEFGTP